MTLAPLWTILLALAVPMPVGTDRRSMRIPWATLAIIVANVAVYLILRPESRPLIANAFYLRYGLVPAAPVPLSFLTSLFVHVSLLHLFWNMTFLLLFGSEVEDALGPAAFLALYLGSGITADLCHLGICLVFAGNRPDLLAQPLVGASGAISGLLAPYAIRFYRSKMRMVWLPGYVIAPALRNFTLPAVALLGLWLAENVAGAVTGAFTVGGGVAYWAHLGGFAFGLIIAEATGLLREGRADYLLADARHEIIASGGTSSTAVQSFREYLKLNPADWRTRLELAVAVRGTGTPAARGESDRIVLETLREHLSGGTPALAVYAEARRLDLEPLLTARERLRLAGVAQDAGQADMARDLLSAIVTETPVAPESEMARLKLGQLLLKWDPREARAVLEAFVAEYPDSDWRDRAEYLLAEAEALLQRQPNS